MTDNRYHSFFASQACRWTFKTTLQDWQTNLVFLQGLCRGLHKETELTSFPHGHSSYDPSWVALWLGAVQYAPELSRFFPFNRAQIKIRIKRDIQWTPTQWALSCPNRGGYVSASPEAALRWNLLLLGQILGWVASASCEKGQVGLSQNGLLLAYLIKQPRNGHPQHTHPIDPWYFLVQMNVEPQQPPAPEESNICWFLVSWYFHFAP